MTEKIGDILFHPSTLINYKDTNLFKVLLYLFILGLITSIVPIIETFKFTGYTYADKKFFEDMYLVKFSDINQSPNCELKAGELTCETNEPYELVNYMNRVSVVFDVDGQFKPTENRFYIRLTEKNIKVSDNQMNLMIISYDELPQSWQEFDIKAIKNAPNSEQAFFELFVSGINEIRNDFIVFEILVKIATMCIVVFFQVFFYCLLFYLLVGRRMYQFFQVFKVSVFAYTLPVIIGLFFSLLHMQVLNSTLLAIITILYIHIALVPKQIYLNDDDEKDE